MYADQIEAQANRSIKDRLDRKFAAGFAGRRPISGKRQREDDDKWEHDLFEDGGPQVSNRRVGVRDLRLKLQRKSIEQAVRGSASGGARDLREKLSGTLYSRPVEAKPPPLRPKPTPEASKPPGKSVIAQAPVPETNVASSVPKKKGQQKVESVDNFLKSLGLEKYSITFQAEEVDMTALVHMSDEDLKAMGIPMDRSSRNKRRRLPTNQAVINCDLYVNLEGSSNSTEFQRRNGQSAAMPPVPPPPPPQKEPTFCCPVCMGPLVEEMSTKCGHIFCKACIKAAIAAQSKCPTCRRKTTVKDLIRVYLPATRSA